VVSERRATGSGRPLLRGPELSIVDGSWHYLHAPSRGHELYDLEADPGETRNLLERHPEVVVVLEVRLRSLGYLDDPPSSSPR